MSMPPPLINGGVALFIIRLQTHVNGHQLPSGTLITPKAIRGISWMVSVRRREKNFQDLSEDNRPQREKIWLIWGGWLSPTYDINLPYRYGLVGDKIEDEKSSKTGYRCSAELCNCIIWLKPSDTTCSFSRVCKPFTPIVSSCQSSGVTFKHNWLTSVVWGLGPTPAGREKPSKDISWNINIYLRLLLGLNILVRTYNSSGFSGLKDLH